MYNFCIALINPAINFALSFKTEDMAKAEREKVHAARKTFFLDKIDSMVTIKDDYGHQLDINASNIAAVLIQDQELCTDRDQDQQVDRARSNAKFLQRRNDDVELMRLFPGNAIQSGRIQ